MGTISSDDITSLFVQEFVKAQNAIGLNPRFLAKSLKSLINAKKTDTFKGEIRTQEPVFDELGQPVFYKDGKIVMAEKTEDVVIYSKPMTDNATRRLALQMALNIRGVQTTSPTSITNINDAKEVNIMGAVAQIMAENGEDVDD